MASHSCDDLPPSLFPLWTYWATQKDKFLTSCHHHRLLEATLVLQREFFLNGQEISNWFVVRRSTFAPKKSQKFLILSNFQKRSLRKCLDRKTCKKEFSGQAYPFNWIYSKQFKRITRVKSRVFVLKVATSVPHLNFLWTECNNQHRICHVAVPEPCTQI